MLRPAAACLGFVDFLEILGNSAVLAQSSYLCETAIERGSGQAHNLGEAGSQNHQGALNSVSQIIGDFRLVAG